MDLVFIFLIARHGRPDAPNEGPWARPWDARKTALPGENRDRARLQEGNYACRRKRNRQSTIHGLYCNTNWNELARRPSFVKHCL